MVHVAETRDAARVALVDRWDAERRAEPAASRMILTHLNKEVQVLNQSARERRAAHGELGENVAVRTERGMRQIANNERILFLTTDRDLGVKNGMLRSVANAAPATLAVRLYAYGHITLDLKSSTPVAH